jgi:hypothetical protein
MGRVSITAQFIMPLLSLYFELSLRVDRLACDPGQGKELHMVVAGINPQKLIRFRPGGAIQGGYCGDSRTLRDTLFCMVATCH